jgi:hypothetical protein
MEKERYIEKIETNSDEEARCITFIAIIAVPSKFDMYKYISPREEIHCKETIETINFLIGSPYFSMDTFTQNIYISDTVQKPNFTIAVILDILDELGLIIQKVPNYTDTYIQLIERIKKDYRVVKFITLNIFALVNDIDLIETYLERVIKIEERID